MHTNSPCTPVCAKSQGAGMHDGLRHSENRELVGTNDQGREKILYQENGAGIEPSKIGLVAINVKLRFLHVSDLIHMLRGGRSTFSTKRPKWIKAQKKGCKARSSVNARRPFWLGRGLTNGRTRGKSNEIDGKGVATNS